MAFFGKAFTKNALFKSSGIVCWLLPSPHSAFDREDLETVKLLLNSKMYIAIASGGDPEFHKEGQMSAKIVSSTSFIHYWVCTKNRACSCACSALSSPLKNYENVQVSSY